MHLTWKFRSGGICAAIKTSELNGLNKRADITWAVFGLFLWSSYVFPLPSIYLS